MCLPDTETQTCNSQLPFTERLLWLSGCWTTAAVTTVSPNRVTHLGWTSQSPGDRLMCLSWGCSNLSPVEYTQVFSIWSYFHAPNNLSLICWRLYFLSWYPDNIIFDQGIYSTSVDVRWLLMFVWLTSLTIYPMTQKCFIDRVTTHLAVPTMALIYALLLQNNYSKCSLCSQNVLL